MKLNLEKIQIMALEFAPKLVLAIVIYIVGSILIRRLSKFLNRRMQNSGMDESLARFLESMISIGLRLVLILSIVAMFGVNVTSFAAILGGLMVGIGMALNGTIGHFASGVLLMIFKPFQVGDLVTIGGGQTGTVEAINSFSTTLATLDNKRVIIGNSNVTGNDIVNISGQGTIGVELTYGIGYDDDIDQARKIILMVGENCPYILDDPAQEVFVGELADSSVNLNTRPFCNSEDYWETYFLYAGAC